MIFVFDLDGTLLNTIVDLGRACNYALESYGFPTHPDREYPLLVGNGVNRLLKRALPEGQNDEKTILKLREKFVEYYDQHSEDSSEPYEGLQDLISKIRALPEAHLAVATNKYQNAAERMVKHYYGDSFDVILGERDGKPRKPDPQIIYDIYQTITGQPAEGSNYRDEMIYIGDSVVDIQAAHNAGIPIIACTWGFCTLQQILQATPEKIADTPAKVWHLIETKQVHPRQKGACYEY